MFAAPVFSLARSAWQSCGVQAPRVLARYAALTYLNRTSRRRRIKELPTHASAETQVPGGNDAAPKTERNGPLGDVVVPIYNNFDDTRTLLNSLGQQGSSIGRIIIVNDRSTDRRIAPLLMAFGDRHANVEVLENADNLGFVRTCNRGLAASSRDCVILNTDIELPPNAITRLLRVLQSSKEIATVTPFSNSAYAVGVPQLNYYNERPFGAETTEVDACFQALRPLAPIALPRGVGFCMAISRPAMRRLGLFREHFGHGYGEEADFCLRAWRLGLRSVLAPHVYVFHKGGQSFAGAASREAREGAIKFLALHPDYVGAVARYLRSGEARAVGFAAMVLLARRISGRDIAYSELTKPSVDDIRRDMRAPELSIKMKGNGVIVTLSLNAECHRFRFANSGLVKAAMLLVPQPTVAVAPLH